MIRFAAEKLDNWLKDTARKPLVMRGARQVGKTWLVRDFAMRHGLELIELNLEKYPHYADLFSENSPPEILKNIEAQFALKIRPQFSCLFLDDFRHSTGVAASPPTCSMHGDVSPILPCRGDARDGSHMA